MFSNSSASTYRYTGPPSNPAVEPFHKTLPNYSITPLVPLPELARSLSLGHVFLKDESHRLGLPAFKILGASWAIYKAIATKCNLSLTSSLDEVGKAAKQKGIKLVTCTEGNWGRAVARMAKYLGITAIIFVPNFMHIATQKKIESEGAEVVVVNGDYDFAVAKAREEAGRGAMLVMDMSWEGYDEFPQWVVEGYITMLTETDKQLQDMGIKGVTHAIASVGVGSWAQAVTMHYKSPALDAPAVVITVEPDSAASLKASLEAKKIVSITTGHTIMDGMNCGTVSTTAWEVLRKGVDMSITVADLDVHHDLQYLHAHGVKNGPCGAAPMSALKKLCNERREELGLNEESVVVLFSTEGAREYSIPDAAV